MPIQKFADHLTMPWPNGKGTSYEIACKTIDGSSDWLWRVAIAPVVEDCEFSHFPDIDRQLIITSGTEMILDVNGQTVVCKPGEIAIFPGDQPTTAHLPDGPIVDLNLLTRRNMSSAVMTYHSQPAKLGLAEIVVAVSQHAKILVDQTEIELDHQDAFVDTNTHDIVLLSGAIALIKL